MQRPTVSLSGPQEPVVIDTEFLKDYPTLTDYLCLGVFEDGTARERSSLTFFVDEAGFKGCLNEKTTRCSLFRSGYSITECLAALEKALSPAGQADWRQWKSYKARK